MENKVTFAGFRWENLPNRRTLDLGWRNQRWLTQLVATNVTNKWIHRQQFL